MRIATSILALSLLCSACGDEDERPRARSERTESAPEQSENPHADLPGDPHMFDVNRDDPHGGAMPTQNPHGGGAPGQVGAGGLTWTAPEPFQSQPPASSMRAAEYVFPEQAGETAATLVVFYFGPGQGGQVQANIDRWVGQFQLPPGEQPNVTQRDAHGLPVTIVDVTGTFAGGGMGPMQPGGGAAQPNQRMLAAIVEGPQGPIFFKMVGDATLMSRAEGPFNELVDSVHPM